MPSIWSIGDIHGQSSMLDALLRALPRTDRDYTVFIGDYIDRGENSAAAVARTLQEYDKAPNRTVLLWGNHEDMAAAHFGYPTPSQYNYDPYDWFANGGVAALESFGYERPGLFEAPVPPGLERLFPLLKTYWRAPADVFPELTHCVWVHAGVLPGQAPEDATGETLLWVREDFLDVFDPSGRLVIHGHTPYSEVRVRPDKIGIDTGAVFGGVLTALQMPERRIWQVDADLVVTEMPLPEWQPVPA